MKTLLLLALLQVPQDTMVVRVPLPAQEVRGDTTVVRVDVTHEAVPMPDSVTLTRLYRAAAEDARAAAIEACGCADDGPPHWFYAGVLTIGAGFLYRYWRNSTDEDEPMDVDVHLPPPPKHPHGHHKPKHGGAE